MKCYMQQLLGLFATAFLFLSALSLQATTYTAASASQADVSTAIGRATDGDTVQIPAGDATWSSTLTLTKAIALKGAGIDKTFIRSSTNILFLKPARDLSMRVSGIYFDLGAFSGAEKSAIRTIGSTVINDLRIDHCGFKGGSRTVFLEAVTYGVLDHCDFLNSDSDINPFMKGTDWGDTSWAMPILPGTISNFVVETNTFTRNNSITADPNEVVYGQNGARICFRYNTVTQTATTRALAAMDAHGYHPSWGHGSVFYEVYNNTYHCHYTYRFCYLRGGTHLWHDNTFITDDGSTPTVFLLTNEQGATQDTIKDSHFWNNTLNGSSNGTAARLEGGYSNPPVLNRDFFNRAIQSGDKYYPYTTLVYPHPRVTAEDSGGPTPTPSPTATPSPTPPAASVGNGTVLPVSFGSIAIDLANAGDYWLVGQVRAPDEGANSVWIDFDADPSGDDSKCWDMPVSAASADAAVTWRGTATGANPPQYNPKVWHLTKGLHTLYLVEREPAIVTSVTFKSTPVPTPTPSPSATPTPVPSPSPSPSTTPKPPATYENWIKKQNDWIRANPPTPDP